jgi:hypothetical protein
MAINPVQLPLLQQRFPDIAGQFIRGRESRLAGERQNRLLDIQEGNIAAQREKQEAERQQKLKAAETQFFGRSAEVLARTPPDQLQQTYQQVLALGAANGVDVSDAPESITPELITQMSNQAALQGFKPTKVEKTSLERNLEAAGLERGTPEFERAVLESVQKGTGTTVNIGEGIGEEQKALAKLRAKELGTIQEEANVAVDTIQSLDVLENIDVNTGALEPAKQGVAAFGRAFGLDTSGLAAVSAGEAFNAEAQKLVLSIKASQKGPQTDNDEATIRDTVANLGNSKQGNQFIIDSSRALSERKVEKADFFNTFLEENETLKGANKAWSTFKRKTPMVSPVLRTPEGLPVFFYKFEKDVRNANPDASRDEIMEAWRQANKGQ